MPGERRVRDLMSPVSAYLKICHSEKIRDAILKLKGSNQPRCLVVVDRSDGAGELKGFLTIANIVGSLSPRKLHMEDMDVIVSWEGQFMEECRLECERRVSEVMSPVPAVLDVNDSIIKAIYTMSKHKVDYLPVVEGLDIVGILSLDDVFADMLRVVMAA
jgi:CBS domain-containing protein